MAKNRFQGMGGMGNMQSMMRQAKKMQEDMEKLQSTLEERSVEGSAGGGVVTACVNGKKELTSISIKPEVCDPDDVEMLEDLVLAAVREAMAKAEEMSANEMSKITGGMNIPGLF